MFKSISTLILATIFSTAIIAGEGVNRRPAKKVTYFIDTVGGTVETETNTIVNETYGNDEDTREEGMQVVINVDAGETTTDPGTLDETYGDETDTEEVGDPIGFQIVINLNDTGRNVNRDGMHDFRYDEDETMFEDRKPRNRQIVINFDNGETTTDPGTLDETYGDETDTEEVGDPIGFEIVVNLDAAETTTDPGTLDETYGDETDTEEVGDPIGAAITINLGGNQEGPTRSVTIRLPRNMIPRN